MSYILDALNRAQSERNGTQSQRDKLPETFAPPTGTMPRRTKLLIGMAILIGAAVVVMGMRMWAFQQSPQQPSHSPAPGQTAPDTPTSPSPADSAARLQTQLTPEQPPLPVPELAATTAPAVILPPPTTQPRNAPIESATNALPPAPPPGRREARTPQTPDAKTVANAKTGVGTSNSSMRPGQELATNKAAQNLPTARALPDAIRREIPQLNVSGFLHASNPADRTVLIDHQLRREGDEIAPGLTLEALERDGMVLVYRGHRFRRGY
jgi:general secretion pathway protein B